MINREKKHLVNRLISLAEYAGVLSTDVRRPGSMMKYLNPEELELCKSLTAEDFQHRPHKYLNAYYETEWEKARKRFPQKQEVKEALAKEAKERSYKCI